MAKDILRNRHASVKFAKENNMEWFGIVALLLLLCYSAYPGKVKRLETKVKRLEKMIAQKYGKKLLEQALIDHLQHFLLELGRGFSFVARQKRFTLDGQDFFIDLVFYNYILKCFVLIDLKMGKLTHQDLGQMQMYVN